MRLEHNRGKIHKAPVAKFELVWKAPAAGGEAKELRRERLGDRGTAPFAQGGARGKDVTTSSSRAARRAEGGCDGLNRHLSRWVHRAAGHPQGRPLTPPHGDLESSARAPRRGAGRSQIKAHVDTEGIGTEGVRLAGLEHMDERYLRAGRLHDKSRRAELPKMVLLRDIVGDDDAAVSARRQRSVVRAIANARRGEGFTAASGEARKKFWLDGRARRRSPANQRLQAERGRW